MSGLYADVPGHRFAYDVDGTLVRSRGALGQWQTIPPATAALMNDEDEADWMSWSTGTTGQGGSSGGLYLNTGDDRNGGQSPLTFVFPQARTLLGYFARATVSVGNQGYFPQMLQVSTDTTDGSDGNWTTILNPWVYSTSLIVPRQRDAIQPITGADNIKGVRFNINKAGSATDGNDWTRLYALHLYGLVVGSNNGLRFWHPTNDVEVGGAYFDFGDLPQGTVTTKQFRLKNTSAQQANNTVISAESNDTGIIAALAAGMTFSQDNSAYAATQTVTAIAAGAISPVLYARRTVGAAEVSSTRAARIKAVPGSWS